MYGIPLNLDLSHFKGRTLIQIVLGEHQIQFIFEPEGAFLVEGEWVCLNALGDVVDRHESNNFREQYRVHCLLGRAIEDVLVREPESLKLIFDNGYALELIDGSDQFESFTIEPDGIIV